MSNLDKLKYYTANGEKFSIDVLSPGGRLINIFGILLVATFYGYGSIKFSTDGSGYFLGPVAILVSIYSLVVIFSKVEFDISTKLITVDKFFGFRKKVKPFSQFTGLTYMPKKYLWFINAGCTAMLNFKDAQGKDSIIYLRTVRTTADIEKLFLETNMLLESDQVSF